MVTLAVLRNNHTMETIGDHGERPRKRQCRRVRFSEQDNQTLVFNNFAKMTEEDRKEMCKQMWYTVR